MFIDITKVIIYGSDIILVFFQILSLFDLYQVNNTKLPVVYIIKSKNINL